MERRAPVSSREVSPTGRSYVGGAVRPGTETHAACSTPPPARPSRPSSWPVAADVDAAVAAAAAAPTRSGRRRRPPSGRPRCTGWPGVLDERAGELRRRWRPLQAGKPIKLSTRVRRAGHGRQHRVLRRRGPQPRGQGGGRVLRRPHLDDPARGRSASSARSRRGTTRCRWPAGRSCRPIAAGNTIVLKPAEITPLTSLMLAEAVHRGGHPGRRGQRRHRHRAASPASTWSAHPDVAMVVVHRVDRASAQRVMQIAAGHRQAGAPRARRQGPVRRLRRRRPGGRRPRRGRRLR